LTGGVAGRVEEDVERPAASPRLAVRKRPRSINVLTGSKSCLFIALAVFSTSALADGGPQNGAAGQMPAFYDGAAVVVNTIEVPASDPLLAHNRSVNTIYASNDLDEEQEFAPVIDAIQGDGFNPLWQQVLIVFNDGFTPHQFFSEDEVLDAADGANPEITLVETDEVYRCSVVGGR
jgi:hypothetical protein